MMPAERLGVGVGINQIVDNRDDNGHSCTKLTTLPSTLKILNDLAGIGLESNIQTMTAMLLRRQEIHTL